MHTARRAPIASKRDDDETLTTEGSEMTVLVLHAGDRYGADSAEAIAAGLGHRGIAAEAASAEDIDAIEPYEAVVVGVPYGHRLRAIEELIRAHAPGLRERPLWVLCQGPPPRLGADSGLPVHAVHPPQGEFDEWLNAFAAALSRETPTC
jgi:hypothetical protein